VAVAESILFLLQANLECLKKARVQVNTIQISGGLANIDGMCQGLADLSQRPVHRPAEIEATARGIAWLAAGSPRHWPPPASLDIFLPQKHSSLTQRYHQFLEILSHG
jgi:glycerol kinase